MVLYYWLFGHNTTVQRGSVNGRGYKEDLEFVLGVVGKRLKEPNKCDKKVFKIYNF